MSKPCPVMFTNTPPEARPAVVSTPPTLAVNVNAAELVQQVSGQPLSPEPFERYLRQKLEAGGERRLLHTVRGRGYCLGHALPEA